jgi:hypothetical protein
MRFFWNHADRMMNALFAYYRMKHDRIGKNPKVRLTGRSPLKASYPQMSLFLTPDGRHAGEITP